MALAGMTLCPSMTWAAARTVRVALIEGFSGRFANPAEAVWRNLAWAAERVNARGGIRLPGGARMLQIVRMDSQGTEQGALAALSRAIDAGIEVVVQGNSSAITAALIRAINAHNGRAPRRRVLLLNCSAADPELTNAACSFWHFRFDAHAQMRMAALMEVLKEDRSLQRVYLIGQDYPFGRSMQRLAQDALARLRPDVRIVGDELHPMGVLTDFSSHARRIVASGAQAVVTGNWADDLVGLVRASLQAGYKGSFYTFYGNALGTPSALREAGVGKVVAVADWLPNLPDPGSRAFYQAFRERFPRPEDDYVHMRMHLMIEALAQAIERARTTEATAVARALERARVSLAGRSGYMRAEDHQFQQPLVVGVLDRLGAPGVTMDAEGTGYGFRVVKVLSAQEASMPTTCRMRRPGR